MAVRILRYPPFWNKAIPLKCYLLPNFANRHKLFCLQSMSRAAFSSTSSSLIVPSHISSLRNIGISAHIDSGKTTLTERILFYSGRIKTIHEVKGSDGVGAKMDSMELERERGITIQSAATYCSWKVGTTNYSINIIDTPGHVDFTIEVERALRVLDGAILVLCAVAGVQSQTITVDRQMKRYKVPRIIFVNKMDRDGADAERVLSMIRKKLAIKTALVTVPVFSQERFSGIVNLVDMKCFVFEGQYGENVVATDIPTGLKKFSEEKRLELLETLADVDDEFAETYLESEEKCTPDFIDATIRRATISRSFCPAFLGSAKGNKGVQHLLDGVCKYLPSPDEVSNEALELENEENVVQLVCDPIKPLVALAFKIQDLQMGQLTYLRIYQGSIKRNSSLINMTNSSLVPVKKIFRMHSDEAQEIESASAGDIVCICGVEANSGTTFTDGRVRCTLTTMFVPDPVVSISIKMKQKSNSAKYMKAINRFQREDPTFRFHIDDESQEHIVSGMGELQLNIYVERMRREYGIEIETGEPKVNFRETISAKTPYNYTYKRQTGGAGQFARIIGYFEPLSAEVKDSHIEFVASGVGSAIPPNFIRSVEKGFREVAQRGRMTGHPVINTRFVLTDGLTHEVDSSDLAFRMAARGAFDKFFMDALPIVLEPIMNVEVIAPVEFRNNAISSLTKRRGTIVDTSVELETTIIQAEVPLKDMFDFISSLRSATQGQGDFSMVFSRYQPLGQIEVDLLRRRYLEALKSREIV